jgi:hypothetical protein
MQALLQSLPMRFPFPIRPALRLVFLLIPLAAAMGRADSADAVGPSPIALLEADVRADLGGMLKAFASARERPALRARVEDDYRLLNDLRNHEAFSALWEGLGWRRDPLRVLYLASGSHLAPLVLLFSGAPAREAEFVFTEIDPAVPGRVRLALRRLEKHGLKGLKERAEGAETVFTFTFGPTRATLRIVMGPKGGSGAGAAPFTSAELERADVVITHDWAGDQRDNLALLADLMRAGCASRRQRPLAVFMEDMEAHPFPVDLAMFHPEVRTPLPYGHLDHVRLPDGARLKAEDGLALYGGAVVLTPDWKAWCALGPRPMETVFNVLLFSDFLFDRLNVDLVAGRRVAAPPMLDLGTGYGYRTIGGEDVRGDADFPFRLLHDALDLTPGLPGPLRAAWCRRMEAFGNALRRAAVADFSAVLKESEAQGGNHPFLTTPREKELLKDILAHREVYLQLKNAEQSAARKTVALLDQGTGALHAACGGLQTEGAP